MLEGLEISEVNFKYVKYSNLLSDDFRIDSNYYKKDFIAGEALIREINHTTLKDSGASLLSFGAYSLNNFVEYKAEGIPFIRGINMKLGRIDFSNMIYIDDKANQLLWKSEVKPKTILLSMSGTIGDVAIASESWEYPINSNQDIAKIRTSKLLNPYYLYTFLRTKYGQNYLIREARGSVQQHVYLSQMERFEIPMFHSEFQDKIEELIILSDNTISKSNANYSQAETLLLETVGLTDFEPSQDGVNIKTFKESFGATSRLDAEYYQKKYDEIEGKFDNFERIRLSDLVIYPICSGTTPKAGGDDYTDATNGIPFVRAVDLQNGEVSVDNFNYIKPAIHNGILKRTKLKKNDVLFSIAGTVGRTAIFKHDFEANINQAVAILRFKENKIRRIYLIVLFNSDIGKEFVSKYSRQGVQTNLNLSELADLSIPMIDLSIQQEIAALVEESFALKAESERLLEVAKRAVEIAIEQDEAAALAYIEQEGGA